MISSILEIESYYFGVFKVWFILDLLFDEVLDYCSNWMHYFKEGGTASKLSFFFFALDFEFF